MDQINIKNLSSCSWEITKKSFRGKLLKIFHFSTLWIWLFGIFDQRPQGCEGGQKLNGTYTDGLALLSHFRAAKNSGAPKPTPRPNQAPNISPTMAPVPTPTMKKSPKASYVRTFSLAENRLLKPFLPVLTWKKFNNHITSFIIMKCLEKHESKILKAKSRMAPIVRFLKFIYSEKATKIKRNFLYFFDTTT